MKLILYFGGPCTLLDERLDFLQLTLISCFKSGRIMEDVLRVAGKGECAIDIVDPALISNRVQYSTLVNENMATTSELGSNWFTVG
jgi:hypothetical protein